VKFADYAWTAGELAQAARVAQSFGVKPVVILRKWFDDVSGDWPAAI
jgi:hypothetical protein